MDDAFGADLGDAIDNRMRNQLHAIAQGDLGPYDAERTDLDAGAEPGALVHDRRRMDRRHSLGVSTTTAVNSTSAASFSPTMALPLNLKMSPRARSTSTGMRRTSPGRTG